MTSPERAEGAIEVWATDLRAVMEWTRKFMRKEAKEQDLPGDSWNRLHMALSGVPCTADRRPLGPDRDT